ncbi:acid-shock protein [Providencia sp. Je.9.19]|uniref:acid-shock protein n=1 Tax=unclassified Providencia TaxID=2633465 RepID=UPI003DA8637D
MKKLLAIATVLSLAVSSASFANTTVKTEPASPVATAHQTAKAHTMKAKVEKKESKGKTAKVAKTAI